MAPIADIFAERLMAEIKTTLANRKHDKHPDKHISWQETQHMPYLQACVKECLRYHPPLGQVLHRDVPPGGTTLCGHHFPEGVVVGCNAWTVHRDKAVYGQNADDFDPDRWLRASPEQLVMMEKTNLYFGGGSRVCIGKNIALLEIHKTIPEMLRRYEMRLVDPSRFRTISGWLTPQVGLDVVLQHRDPAELL